MDKKYWLIILLMICILAVCSLTTYKVLKYYEGFSNDPLVYGARLHNVDVCTCFTSDGETFFFNQTTTWQKITYKSPELEINFTIGK